MSARHKNKKIYNIFPSSLLSSLSLESSYCKRFRYVKVGTVSCRYVLFSGTNTGKIPQSIKYKNFMWLNSTKLWLSVNQNEKWYIFFPSYLKSEGAFVCSIMFRVFCDTQNAFHEYLKVNSLLSVKIQTKHIELCGNLTKMCWGLRHVNRFTSYLWGKDI